MNMNDMFEQIVQSIVRSHAHILHQDGAKVYRHADKELIILL